jgi:hypothetical protein
LLEEKPDFFLIFLSFRRRRNHIIFLLIALSDSSFVGKTNWMLTRLRGFAIRAQKVSKNL